ncbi:MAG: hypothetical protein HY904_25500 [Deltaproteobacteria bacterium]|nr:hypothetical protein [Deltaproteobacteria bacterium]
MTSMKRVAMGMGVALSCLVLGAADCGGGTPEGCASDADCASGDWCRSADGACYSAGFCYAPTDCAAQGLIHPQCVGNFNCANNTCAWLCGGTGLPGMGESCSANSQCAPGLECVSYYGIAGPSGPQFHSCEKRCSSAGDCGTGETCVTIADGPGQVCRIRNG